MKNVRTISTLIGFSLILVSDYPETLEKMVMYPVPRVMASAVNVMLNFVNENTRKKFVITDDLLVVCKGQLYKAGFCFCILVQSFCGTISNPQLAFSRIGMEHQRN